MLIFLSFGIYDYYCLKHYQTLYHHTQTKKIAQLKNYWDNYYAAKAYQKLIAQHLTHMASSASTLYQQLTNMLDKLAITDVSLNQLPSQNKSQLLLRLKLQGSLEMIMKLLYSLMPTSQNFSMLKISIHRNGTTNYFLTMIIESKL